MRTMTKTTTTKPRKRNGKSKAKANRVDVHTRVTNRIIEQLEQGIRPWLKPWDAEHAAGKITRPLRHNGVPYSGINILMLWDAAELQGFNCPLWVTYKQAMELGGHVRKGEKSSPVVYYSSFKKTEKGEGGEETERDVPFVKEYRVFNAQQCEGLPERFYEAKQSPNEGIEPVPQAIEFVRHTKAEVVDGGNRACYVQSHDQIRMPRIESFQDTESHAATLTHELVHWTKHPSRLDRDTGRKKWGDEGYAVEELIAEMGSAFLCADLAITPEVRADHSDYIGNWLKVLKDDKRAVFSAASMASKAVDYLHTLQPAEEA